MAGPLRPRLLIPLLAAGAGLWLGTAPVAASVCSGAYVAQLAQVREQLEAGGSVPAALTQLRELALASGAEAALDPVIVDLQSGDPAGAEQLLGTTVATLRLPSGSGCGAETGAERRALSGVYGSPALAHLDQPASPNWAQQLLNAISGWVSGVVGGLGPLAAATVAALLLGGLLAFIAWRFRQVTAAGREPRAAPAAAGAGADAEAEWDRALVASDRGDFRTAIRHAFRSALVSLVRRGRLEVQPAWTTPELLAHARGDPELAARLAPAAAGFDRAWYSEAPVDSERWEEVRGHCQAIRALAGRGRTPS
jgi:hypothetical protein